MFFFESQVVAQSHTKEKATTCFFNKMKLFYYLSVYLKTHIKRTRQCSL